MKLEGKTVCVTGAAGFLGRHLCPRLVQRGARVIAVDHFAIGEPESLAPLAGQVEVVRCDIRDPEGIREVVSRSQVVYHLAAQANPRTCRQDFARAFDVNVNGLANVLRCSQHCERVIFLSSIMVYGEPRYLPIDEQHPLDGHDPYSISKIICEQLLTLAWHIDRIPLTVVRNSNTFGPGQGTDYLIPTLILQGLTRGEIEIWDPRTIRDFLYVDDTVEALVRLAEAEAAAGEVVNLGSGQGIAAGELADIVSSILGVPWTDARKPAPVSSKLIANTTKLRALTGWSPRVSLEDGLRRTIEYYRQRVKVEAPV